MSKEALWSVAIGALAAGLIGALFGPRAIVWGILAGLAVMLIVARWFDST